jgi:hypothetical protein
VFVGQANGPATLVSTKHALPHGLPAHLVHAHALFEVESDILHVGSEYAHLLDGIRRLLITWGVDAAAITSDHEVRAH